eukprot:1071701-Rhodomonas_salina.1
MLRAIVESALKPGQLEDADGDVESLIAKLANCPCIEKKIPDPNCGLGLAGNKGLHVERRLLAAKLGKAEAGKLFQLVTPWHVSMAEVKAIIAYTGPLFEKYNP